MDRRKRAIKKYGRNTDRLGGDGGSEEAGRPATATEGVGVPVPEPPATSEAVLAFALGTPND